MERKKTMQIIFFVSEEAVLLFLLFYFLGIYTRNLSLKGYFLDPLPIIITHVVPLLMLGCEGLFFSFFYAFALCVGLGNVDMLHFKHCILAVRLYIITALVTNVVYVIFGFVAGLDGWCLLAVENAHKLTIDVVNSLLISIATSAGMSVHGLFVVLVLLPVYFRLLKRYDEERIIQS